MSHRKWLLPLLLSLPLAAFVLFLGACLPVGLGDPEASEVDPKLAGVWQEWKDGPERALVALIPFDERAYLLRTLEIERTEEGIRVKAGEGCYKAWLTPIEGRTFLTGQPLYLPEALDGDRPGFFVVRIDLAADGSKLTGHGIDLDFPALAPLKKLPGHMQYEAPGGGETALSPDEARALLRKVVTENVGNDKLYEGTGEYRRVTDKAILKAVFETVTG